MKELIKDLKQITSDDEFTSNTIKEAIRIIKEQSDEIRSLNYEIKLLENFIDGELEYL